MYINPHTQLISCALVRESRGFFTNIFRYQYILYRFYFMRSLRLRAYIVKYAHYIPRLQVHFLSTGVDKMFANFYTLEKRGETMTVKELEARVDSLEKAVANLSEIVDKLKHLLPPDYKQVKQNSLKFR